MTRRITVCAVLSALAMLTGCGRQSMLSPGGPASENIAELGWFVFILFSGIGVIMWILLVWICLRRRGTLAEHEPIDAGGGHNWILIGGFIIPFIVLAGTFVLGLDRMSAFPLHGEHHEPADILVIGHQWWWEIQYVKGPAHDRFVTANEIHIPVGQAVNIDLTSVDVIHSFFEPRLHGKVDLIPNQYNRIRIEASHPGVYRGQCAEYCGAQHANMVLLVVADTPDEYKQWFDHQLQDAVEPVTDQQKHGQQLFFGGPCATCHTVRGTAAGGRTGPELTHFASRLGLASNAFPNNEATLAGWVTHAQSMKPEVEMPNITQFNGTDLLDLVAYLRNLK